MKKPKSITRNYIYNIAYEVLTVLVPLVTTPHISKAIGAQGIGVYSYTNSIVTYFALFAALGTTVYGRREVAYVQQDKEKRSVVFWEIFLLRAALTLIFCAAYSLYVVSSKYRSVAIIQSIYIISVAFDITWFFQGVEEYGKVVLRNGLVKLVNMVVVLTLVQNKDDLIIYVFSLAMMPLLGFVITWLQLPDYVIKVKCCDLHPARHLKGAFQLFLPTIISQVFLVLDKTLLGVFTTDPVENGYYEQSQKILQICWTFVTSLSTVLAPRIALSYANRNKKQICDYMTKSIRMVWLISLPIAFGLFSVADHVVPWFLGSEFAKSVLLLKIGAWTVIPIGLYSITGAYLIGSQDQKVYSKTVISGAVLNLTMNLMLVPRLFSVATACAALTTHSLIFILQLRHIITMDSVMKLRDFIQPAWQSLVSASVMLGVVSSLANLMEPTLLGTAVLVVVGAAVYFTLLLIMREPVIWGLIEKLKNRLRRLK